MKNLINRALVAKKAKFFTLFLTLVASVGTVFAQANQACIDYLDLNQANCYVNNSNPLDTRTFNDFRLVSPVDSGSASMASRHTVHLDTTETDLRTGGMAKTVPTGALGSVRLGNWDSGNQAERIEYTFVVDSTQPILSVKYLPILEAPSHDDYENPRFKIDVLIHGQSIGGDGQLDINANDLFSGSSLTPEAIADGWHITPASTAQTSADILWKDWTTKDVFFDSYYHGYTVTVRLMTYDCTFSAHCGYAYFTLGCSARQEEQPCLIASGTCGAQGDNLTWELGCDSVLTISGTGAMTDWNTITGSPWYSYEASIKSVVIGDGVTRIGKYAFFRYTGLTSVTVSNSVTSVGYDAFYGCNGLTTPLYNAHLFIYLPTSFEGAYSIPDGVEYIIEDAFYGCKSLTAVTIPNSVTSIERMAFSGCSSLTSLTIGNNVTNIGQSAFNGCSSLTAVTIPNSVKNIEMQAFYGCSSLTSVTIGNSVTSIGSSAFSGCAVLTSIDIPNSVTSIGDKAFYNCTGMTSAIIGNGVTSIGESAFDGCSGLTSVTIGNSVTSIGKYAFYGCKGLTSVTIPDSVTSIGMRAFNQVLNIVYYGLATGSPWGARNMNGYVDGWFVYQDASKTKLIACSSYVTGEVTIPGSVTSIGNSAFESCAGITSVIIPNSVDSIGQWAFNGCRNLTGVYINDIAAWCTINFLAYNSNPLYFAHKLYLNDELITDLVIPNGVTSIGNYAFYGYSGLTSITNYSTIPQQISADVFGKVNKSDCILYVPEESVASYRTADNWQDFVYIAPIGGTPTPSVILDGCINYINFADPNVICTYGENPMYRSGASPYESIGCINYGPNDEYSRHTICRDLSQTDPRTDNMLHTVPEGAVASVRLGNWNCGGEAESITYLFVPDTDNDIVIINYAVVFENEGDTHTSQERTYFQIEVLDANDQLIDEICGHVHVTSEDAQAAGWHTANSGQVFFWKDWTKMGVHLAAYHGQTVKIRFTTSDCAFGGHAGYAYFTLDCTSSKIQMNEGTGSSCTTLKAPDGFSYAWYNETDPTTIISNEQAICVDPTQQTYICRVSHIEQPDCYFDISSVQLDPWDPEHPNNPGNYRLTLEVTDTLTGYTIGSGLYEQGATAHIEAVAKEGYEFVKWSDNDSTAVRDIVISRDCTLTADFTARYYRVQFVNYNGLRLQLSYKMYGAIPSYVGAVPVHPASANYEYTFAGWYPEVGPTTRDTIYTAVFDSIFLGDEVVEVWDNQDITELPVGKRTHLIVSPYGELHVSQPTIIKKLTIQKDTACGEVYNIERLSAETIVMEQSFTPNVSDISTRWFAFGVPFAVSIANGISKANASAFYGSDYVIDEYDGVLRADTQDGWKRMAATETLYPGKLYMLSSREASQWCFKAADPSHVNNDYWDVSVKAFPSAFGDHHAGWNGIANPLTYKAYAYSSDIPFATIYDNYYGVYRVVHMNDYLWKTGDPFFVQSARYDTVFFAGRGAGIVSNDPWGAGDPIGDAPRRKMALEDEAPTIIELASTDYTDQAFLNTVADRQNSYTIGMDLEKLQVSNPSVPQVWIEAYGTHLAAHAVSTELEDVPLTLGFYAPQEGTYTLSISNLPSNVSVCLTQNGTTVSNLTYLSCEVSLQAGNNSGYALTVSKTPTGLDAIDATHQTTKILRNGQLFILRGEKVYTVTGQEVR